MVLQSFTGCLVQFWNRDEIPVAQYGNDSCGDYANVPSASALSLGLRTRAGITDVQLVSGQIHLNAVSGLLGGCIWWHDSFLRTTGNGDRIGDT